MKRTALLFVFILAVSIFTGCGEREGYSENLKPLRLRNDPTITQYSDPDVSLSKYRTFCVVGGSTDTDTVIPVKPAFDNELLEKYILSTVRNYIQASGYMLEPDPARADIIVFVNGSNEYRSKDVPARTKTKRKWVRTETIETTIRSDTYPYEEYTVETEIPGHYENITSTIPAYTVSAYYPCIEISILETETKKTIWYGNAEGSSFNPDLRVSCQRLIFDLHKKIKNSRYMDENIPYGNGMMGFRIIMITINGDNTYPIIIWNIKDSPAAEAHLGYGDIIIKIDGVSTRNKSFTENMKLLQGDADTECTLTIKRGDKEKDVPLMRIPRGEQKPYYS